MNERSTPPVIVVMGVSGSGKSTVAALIAGHLGWEMQEGDDLHPASNVAKMAAGTPLTDEDRWPWLDLIGDWIDERQAAGRPGVVTCSALKRAYRERIGRPGVVFVHVDGSRELLGDRLGKRLGHFMPAALLDSQFAALEPLQADEPGFTVSADQPAESAAAEAVDRLRLDGTLAASPFQQG